jgi:hypothetical protein
MRKQGYRWAGQSSKTGNLATLQAAVSSAHAVEKWAQGQEFASVNVLTDEAGPVTIQQIKSAIKAIVEKGTIEQLFVYFFGHGVNIRYGEYWLLSDAPDDTQSGRECRGQCCSRPAGRDSARGVSVGCLPNGGGRNSGAVC